MPVLFQQIPNVALSRWLFKSSSCWLV